MNKSETRGVVDFCVNYKDHKKALDATSDEFSVKHVFSLSYRQVGYMAISRDWPYFELDEEDIDYLYNKYSKLLKEQINEITK